MSDVPICHCGETDPYRQAECGQKGCGEDPKPMVGLLGLLTDEQKAAMLSNDTDVNFGPDELKRKPHSQDPSK